MSRGTDTARAGLVIVMAGQRSGSNHFLDLIRGGQGLVVLSEVFNARAVYGLESHPDLARDLTEHHGGPEQMHRAFRLHPERALRVVLERVGAGRQVVIKLCPAQLHLGALRRILAGEESQVIFLVRRRLDQYVSRLKALATGQWQNADTTNFCPEAHVDEFLGWSSRLDDWFASLAQLCAESGVTPTVISYDAHLNLADPAEVARGLRALLANVLPSEGLADPTRPHFFRRQDQSRDSFAKIANAEQFRALLECYDLLDHALSAPCFPADPVPDRDIGDSHFRHSSCGPV